MNKRNIEITDIETDLQCLSRALDGGKAAAGVMAGAMEAKPIYAKLAGLSSLLYAHEVTKSAFESMSDEEPPAEQVFVGGFHVWTKK